MKKKDFYTQDDVDRMLRTYHDSDSETKADFEKYVMERERQGMDAQAFRFIFKNANLLSDVFDRFDSAVEDQFIKYFEQTFMNPEFMGNHGE